MTSKQLARIRKMEDDFNLVREVIDTLDGALYDYEAVQRRIKRLADYQESGQWLRDFEADEQGLFPEDLKRGVLSEDGIYDLLERNKEVMDKLKMFFEEDE